MVLIILEYVKTRIKGSIFLIKNSALETMQQADLHAALRHARVTENALSRKPCIIGQTAKYRVGQKPDCF